MKVVADSNLLGVEELFSMLGDVEMVEGRSISTRTLEGADIVLVRSVTRVDAELLGDCRPGFIGTATSGYDHIDRALLESRGIEFAHAPGSNADSVVDYVLSAIARCDDMLERLLAGASVGIVGYGHIGKAVGSRLEKLGAEVRAYDPWLALEKQPVLTDLDRVLDSDIVSVHAQLTDAEPWPSRHLLSASALSGIRPGTLLINAARGEIIDSAALLEGLRVEPERRVILDVWEGEPNVPEALLSRCLFGTAHVAGCNSDSKRRATYQLRLACQRWLGRDTEGWTYAAPTGPKVEIPIGCKGADLVRFVLAQVYDIAVDDALLRARVPESFDVLRNEYRERRELTLVDIINKSELDSEQLQLLEALGC